MSVPYRTKLSYINGEADAQSRGENVGPDRRDATGKNGSRVSDSCRDMLTSYYAISRLGCQPTPFEKEIWETEPARQLSGATRVLPDVAQLGTLAVFLRRARRY